MHLGNGVSSPGRHKQEKGLGANSDSPSSMQKPDVLPMLGSVKHPASGGFSPFFSLDTDFLNLKDS